MKYTPLMPFLIAAAFYLPHAHAHAAEQPAAPHGVKPARIAAALSPTPTERSLPATSGYALLLTALSLSLLAMPHPKNAPFTNPA